MQSFGGGIATFALIHRTAVDRYGWMSDAEFTQEWAMVQLAPGINLLALTILIGRRVCGVAGMLAALAGLLLPSVLITVAVTAAYAHIRSLTIVQSALRGALPAIVALGLLTSVQMAQPIIKSAIKEGRFNTLVCLLVLVVSGCLALNSRAPIVAILILSGSLSGAIHWLLHNSSAKPQGEEATE